MAVGGKRRRPTTREEAFRRAMELNIIFVYFNVLFPRGGYRRRIISVVAVATMNSEHNS